jgi:hypothetical protein
MHIALFGDLKETENGWCLVWGPEKRPRMDVVFFGDMNQTENGWCFIWGTIAN